MKKIKNLSFIFIICVLLSNCSTVKEGFMNDKKSGTDEFLVQKKQPLTMPPNFEKLPLPNTALEENNKDESKKTSSLEKLLKGSNKEKEKKVDKNQTQSNSIESLILKEIKK